MRLTCLSIFFLVSPLLAQDFHQQAIEESLMPIRPGEPGKSPFWNAQARQFIWAPAFDFKAVEHAKTYRFTAISEDGTSHCFDALDPWAPLTPIWKDLPVGATTLKVEALDAAGKTVGVAGQRQFHRASAFAGPYGKPVVSYDQSAQLALKSLVNEKFIQAWKATGKPDPAYALYRYAAKVIGGGVVSGCALYAKQTPRPDDADDALAIARNAADFLIGISAKPGSPLEFFPPTYHDAKPTERENDDWEMLISPAEAGTAYLDLYDVTHDTKYLDAATHIAGTYQKLQLPSGTWPLKVDSTGKPLAQIDLIPSVVIRFLDRLITDCNQPRYQPMLDRAVAWMMDNPVRTFNWQAQFDDAKLRGPYENLAKHEACDFASYLLRHADHDAKKIALAEEILRFAEDQFVVWERPPAIKARSDNLSPQNWFTPCSTEQYAMFEPISGSSAFMIIAYLRAYEATDKKIYLAKAESVGTALTIAQEYHHGRYPTRMIREDLAYWINSTVNTALAMEMLANAQR